MKILYIITQADGGGAQKYVLALAKHFGGTIAAGHSTLRDEPSGSDSKSNEATQLFADARNLEVPCVELKHLKRSINLWHDLLAVWEIRQLIKNLQPDIVHLNSSKAGVLGSFACVGLKTNDWFLNGRQKSNHPKIVFTAHGFIFNEPLNFAVKNFYLALEKIASDYRDFIITVSDADRNSALANKLIAPNKIATIHNGIGQIKFLDKPQAKAALKLPDDKIIVGTIANFYKTKGLDMLIEAVAMMDEGIKSKINIVIIGDGSERKNLELKIKKLELGNCVKLLGKIPDAQKYLKAFDAFVLPSRKEGLSYTLLEAMQAGLPIIATEVGGNPEALGNAGLLIDPETPQVLAQVITKLIHDENLSAQLAAKARQKSAEFTETQMLQKTEGIYRRILSK